MSQKVKDGIDAAMNFMTAANAGDKFKVATDAPKRDRRVGFVMTEDDYNTMKRYCDANNVSVSEFINQAVKWVIARG